MTRYSENAVAEIRLRKHPDHKTLQVLFNPLGGEWHKARFSKGLKIGAYKRKWKEVNAEGEDLSLDHIYVFNRKSRPEWVVLFTNDGQ